MACRRAYGADQHTNVETTLCTDSGTALSAFLCSTLTVMPLHTGNACEHCQCKREHQEGQRLYGRTARHSNVTTPRAFFLRGFRTCVSVHRATCCITIIQHTITRENRRISRIWCVTLARVHIAPRIFTPICRRCHQFLRLFGNLCFAAVETRCLCRFWPYLASGTVVGWVVLEPSNVTIVGVRLNAFFCCL